MYRLTTAEIMLILDAFGQLHGIGYSADPAVGRLQAKLSVWLEMKVADGDAAFISPVVILTRREST
jgi:hypothetical protein